MSSYLYEVSPSILNPGEDTQGPVEIAVRTLIYPRQDPGEIPDALKVICPGKHNSLHTAVASGD